jgi:hypothetical protein
VPRDIQPAEPQTKYLTEWDPDGDTWVRIAPAGFVETRHRAELLKTRSEAFEPDGTLRVDTNLNNRTLWLEEIALTFAGTNLTVGGKPLFEKDNVPLPEFKEKINEINPPDELIKEWVMLVREVNPDWQYPFRGY